MMFGHNRFWVLRIWLTSLLVCGLAHPGAGCVQASSDYVVVKDGYSNYDYGYSVRIPKGLTALRAPAPLPNHGFEIHVSEHPKADLSVSASYNAAEWGSFDDAIDAHVGYFKNKVGGEVDIGARVSTVLGGLRAVRFTMKSKTSAEVREVLLAFRKAPGEVGIVYEIVLTTPSSRYNQDKHLINDIQKTWRMKPLPKH